MKIQDIPEEAVIASVYQPMYSGSYRSVNMYSITRAARYNTSQTKLSQFQCTNQGAAVNTEM
jgi:hypothetical protein